MTTYSSYRQCLISTTTPFRALVAWYDSSIQSAGWVVTADTGQLDPTTVTAPSAGSSGGYRIYRTNDAFARIYLRIDYFRDANSNLKLVIQIGWSTDGAGTINGNKSESFTLSMQSNLASFQREYDVAGSTSWLSLFAQKDAPGGSAWQYMLAFHICRSVDQFGNEVDGKANLFCYSGQQIMDQQFVPSSGYVPGHVQSSSHFIIASIPSSSAGSTADTAVVNLNTLVMFPHPITNFGGGWPVPGVFMYAAADLGVAGAIPSVVKASPYFVDHLYLTLMTISARGVWEMLAWRFE